MSRIGIDMIDFFVSAVIVACFVVNSFSLMLVLNAVTCPLPIYCNNERQVCGQEIAYFRHEVKARIFAIPWRQYPHMSPNFATHHPFYFSSFLMYTIDLMH